MTKPVVAAPATPPGESRAREEPKSRGPKQAELVIQAVAQLAELFHDRSKTAYVTVAKGAFAHTMKLGSRAFRTWAAHTVRTVLGHSVNGAAMDEALMVLEGIAIHEREEHSVHVRVAESHGAIYVDLGDDTGDAVSVTSRGWEIVTSPPVKFLRPDSMRSLARPARGGSVADLRPFVNVADDNAFVLLVAWLVAAFRPGRPCPILALHGEQGTGKSTASRVARSLIDPSAAMVRSVPRSEDDLLVATLRAYVLAYDNLSGVPVWLSDALCRLVTGAGFSKRALFTDDDEVVIEAIRPIIINGIDDLAHRADLAERCIVLALEPIAKRRDESTFWADFERAAPRIVGALLDGVASALAHVTATENASLPRMADFARWTAAAESGLGFAPGAVMTAYRANMSMAVDVAIDASPVACAVRDLLASPACAGCWEGTSTALLSALGTFVSDDVKRAKEWPKLPNRLAGELRRASTFLRRTGIVVTFGHRGNGKWLTIAAEGDDDASTASTDRRSGPDTPRTVSVDPLAATGSARHANDGAAHDVSAEVDGSSEDRRTADTDESRPTVDAVDTVDESPVSTAATAARFADYLNDEGIGPAEWHS